jgi:hypothetical protein
LASGKSSADKTPHNLLPEWIGSKCCTTRRWRRTLARKGENLSFTKHLGLEGTVIEKASCRRVSLQKCHNNDDDDDDDDDDINDARRK